MNDNYFDENDRSKINNFDQSTVETGMNETIVPDHTWQEVFPSKTEAPANSSPDTSSSWENMDNTWHERSIKPDNTINTSSPANSQETAHTDLNTGEEPVYGNAAVFSGSGEAEVDYSIAKGSSTVIYPDSTYSQDTSGSYNEFDTG